MKRLVVLFVVVLFAFAALAAPVLTPNEPSPAFPDAPDDGDAGGSDAGVDTGTNDSGACIAIWDAQVCSSAGQTGCAGAGGTGGIGGRGGGAAIALFVSSGSSVTVTNGGFFTGIGGNGGNGGDGGAGGVGMAGMAGSGAFCHSTCVPNCTPSGGVSLEGGAGGTASSGAGGGVGGGGAGGSTYFFAAFGDASVTVSPATLAASQHKGTPGPGGYPNGPDGGEATEAP